MKRLPIFAGIVLMMVLVSVTVLVRSTYAVNDPIFCSCGGANSYISSKWMECLSHPGAVSWGEHCFDPADGHPGSYHYSCSWFLDHGNHQIEAGGFGGGNVVDPTDPTCQY